MTLRPMSLVSLLALAGLAPLAHGQNGAPDQHQAAEAVAADFTGHKVVRVQIRDLKDARTIARLSDDPWNCRYSPDQVGQADFRFTPEAFDGLVASGIPYTVLIENVQALIDAERARLARPVRGPGWYTDYKDYAAVQAQLNTLIAARPDLISRVSIGNSLEARQIPCVRIAGPGVAVGSKPAIVVIGCQHAREWITVMSTMYLADRLVSDYGTDLSLQGIVNNFEIYIIPITNPDGYAFSWSPTGNRLWRKNRRPNGDGSIGVDLNRNWNFRWGTIGTSTSPNSDIYHGAGPFSEPESTNVSNFTSGLSNLAMFFDVHSYSQLILEPWGDTFNLPPDTRTFAQMTRQMQAAMAAPFGTAYLAGPGYRTIYATSGTADEWAYGVRGGLGLAFELRDTGTNGFVLPPDQIVPTATELLAGFRTAMEWMLNNAVGIDFPNSRPTRVAAGSNTGVQVQFNQGLKKLANLTISPPSVSVRQGRVAAFSTSTLSSPGSDESGPVYQHSLSAGACGSVVQWYYSVQLSDGSTVTLPPEGAAKPYEAVAQQFTDVFVDDFEINRGWLVGDPTPGQGDVPTTPPPSAWIRSDPNGTQCQAEFDHTILAGVNCYFTGQNARNDTFGAGRVGRSSAGANQVQKTTLLTPIFNLAGAADAEISFWLWFANSRQYSPDDGFSVDITSNASAGTPTWVNALTIAPAGPVVETSGRWNRYVLRLAGLTPPTGAVRLRFVAREDGNGDAVEAAVDDFAVRLPVCQRVRCPADFNGDGALGVQDLFDFLAAWFAGAPSADVNNSNGISVQDIFDFLATWFAGCP